MGAGGGNADEGRAARGATLASGGAGDGLAVLEAEEVLEQDLHREGEAGDVAELGGGFFEGVISVGLRADLEVGPGFEGVVADGGHREPFGFGRLSVRSEAHPHVIGGALAIDVTVGKGGAIGSCCSRQPRSTRSVHPFAW